MNKAIIVAGGVGSRLGLGFNKVFYELDGIPLLAYTTANFEGCEEIHEIVICAGNPVDGTAGQDVSRTKEMVRKFGFVKVRAIVAGGSTRMESVEEGLRAASPDADDLVLIQDGSRPFGNPRLISKVIEAANIFGAAVCGAQPKDTIQLLDGEGFAVSTPDRSKLTSIHTPVAARWKILREARRKASAEGYLNTPGFEDSALLVQYGIKVKIVESPYTNMKITTPEDLEFAAKLIRDAEKQGFPYPFNDGGTV